MQLTDGGNNLETSLNFPIDIELSGDKKTFFNWHIQVLRDVEISVA